MDFTKDGVPTHASYMEAWDYRKKAVITKKCKVSGISGGRHYQAYLYPGDEVWALLYVSAGLKRPRYVIKSPRLGSLVSVPVDAIRIIKGVINDA